MLCNQCNQETNNPKFCSRKCAVTHNNLLGKTGRKLSGKHRCRTCNIVIQAKKTWCSKCEPDNMYLKDISLKDAKYYKHRPQDLCNLVRTRARAVAKKLRWKKCKWCGYDKHIEICHIKPISDFSDDTLLSVINDPNNLIGLCPNCHWEHDHIKVGP